MGAIPTSTSHIVFTSPLVPGDFEPRLRWQSVLSQLLAKVAFFGTPIALTFFAGNFEVINVLFSFAFNLEKHTYVFIFLVVILVYFITGLSLGTSHTIEI